MSRGILCCLLQYHVNLVNPVKEMNNAVTIRGGGATDVRGTVRFVNDFDMTPVKRFYTVSNSAVEPKRGWIMHHKETKWFFPLRGETIIHVEAESGKAGQTFSLKVGEPVVLCVPPGNWFLIEQDGDAEVQVFSNCLLGEFPNDDFRRGVAE